MEKRRSSRKPEQPILPSVQEKLSVGPGGGVEESASYEIVFKKNEIVLKKKHSDFVAPFSGEESTYLKAFSGVLKRWIELNDPKAPLELRRVLSAAERLAQKILWRWVGNQA